MQQPRTAQRLNGPDAIGQIPALLAGAMEAPRLLLVSDAATRAAAGAQVEAQLAGRAFTHRTLASPLRPQKELAESLAQEAAACDAILAIGSGTINDLCKYAAFLANKPYAVVATAASMNGYSSANASLEAEGHKQSFAARPPLAVIADSAILAAAPKRLTRAGIGDTLCRSTVEADMLLSHLLFDTPYPRATFDLLRRHEATLLTGLMQARDSEAAFVACLMEALLDAGDAMTQHGSSAVASQGEHMIAHTLELKYGEEMRSLLHGELIAVTTLTMSRLQQRVLLTAPRIKPMPCEGEQFARRFGARHAATLGQAYAEKSLNEAQAARLNARIEQNWPDMVAALTPVMVPGNTLERAFVHSGIHTHPSQIGLAEERYRFAASYAYLTRERFGFLDLAAMNVKRAA